MSLLIPSDFTTKWEAREQVGKTGSGEWKKRDLSTFNWQIGRRAGAQQGMPAPRLKRWQQHPFTQHNPVNGCPLSQVSSQSKGFVRWSTFFQTQNELGISKALVDGLNFSVSLTFGALGNQAEHEL